MSTNIIPFPAPAPAEWIPTAAQLREIRAYCARVEGKRPGAITIEATCQPFERVEVV